ncbi:MAG: hypothetical protein KAX31_02735, partial [Thermoplasmata archaeon]|nr:hypothetical protein [Thermoplasmata archaeon]
VTIFYWGIKNDSLYHDKELAKKELEEPYGPEPLEEPEPIEEPVAEIDTAEERERVEFCKKMLLSAYILDEDMEMLRELIGTGIGKEEFSEAIVKAVDRRREREEDLEKELAEELSEINGDEDIDEILRDIEELEDF